MIKKIEYLEMLIAIENMGYTLDEFVRMAGIQETPLEFDLGVAWSKFHGGAIQYFTIPDNGECVPEGEFLDMEDF